MVRKKVLWCTYDLADIGQPKKLCARPVVAGTPRCKDHPEKRIWP